MLNLTLTGKFISWKYISMLNLDLNFKLYSKRPQLNTKSIFDFYIYIWILMLNLKCYEDVQINHAPWTALITWDQSH